MFTPPPNPFGELVGLEYGPAADGHASLALQTRPELCNPHGVMHGAALFALADTAMGAATTTLLKPGQICASIEVQIRFLKAVRAGKVSVDCSVVAAGRRVVHLEALLADEEDELVAFATGSFMVITSDKRPAAT